MTFNHAESNRAPYDVEADTDPDSVFWRVASVIRAEQDNDGKPAKEYRTEIRSRWTPDNLYFLFVCPYKQLNLKPNPQTHTETNELWNWDVAEVFIGSDLHNIQKYKEFEVSPQGEWVDLDINLNAPHFKGDWKWNSGLKVSARVAPEIHKWYGFMRIPYASVDSIPASAGNNIFRINFFLSEGLGPNHKAIAWQPTHQSTFHVPKVFGTLKLVN